MIERQTELKRRYHRKVKMKKLKAKLAKATGPDKEAILIKIKKLSPMWTEASLNPGSAPAAPKAEKKAAAPKAEKKAPAKKAPAAK